MKNLKLKLLIGAAMSLLMFFAAVAQPQGGQGGQRRAQGTPEEQAKAYVERMSEQLSLNDKQSKEIYTFTLEANKQRAEMMKDGARPDREKMEAMRKASDEKMKKILDAEQYKKYEKMQAEMQKRREGGQRPQPQQ